MHAHEAIMCVPLLPSLTLSPSDSYLAISSLS